MRLKPKLNYKERGRRNVLALFDPGFVGLLDLIPNAYELAAWDCSQRLGLKFNTPPVRLRRDSDNAERDFYAVSSSGNKMVVSEAEVTAWAGGGFHIRKLYDQTGNGYDAVQATLGLQPVGSFVNGRLEAVFVPAAHTVLDFYSVAFSAAFSGVAGSWVSRQKVRAASVWTDGVSRYGVRIKVDTNNFYTYAKLSAPDNTFIWQANAGGTSYQPTKGSLTTTDWFDTMLTWGAVDGKAHAYYAPSGGAVIEVGTGGALGTWAGVPDNIRTVIGAELVNGLAGNWDGSIASALLLKRALTLNENSLIHNWLSA